MRLEMVTTNVTNRRAERLPWATTEFYFHPGELRDLFPERIVRWLEEHHRRCRPRPRHAPRWSCCAASCGRCPAPHAADLPVLVATRMSLSFPVLLSAVPLWRVDWSRKRNLEARTAWREWTAENAEAWEAVRAHPDRIRGARPGAPASRAERCWFSDGGIARNFPVHFFDASCPAWPTFAINLRPFHPDREPSDRQCENVWMVERQPRGGIVEWWYRFEGRRRWVPGHIVGPCRTGWTRRRCACPAIATALSMSASGMTRAG